jgi:diguanylate cyclase (GGDEF)-like protein
MEDRRESESRHPLTNLPNLLALKEGIRGAVEAMPGNFALLEMDIDGLKEVNDTYGHAEGDQFLQTVGEVIDDILREDDFFTPAHKSGDEFSVILLNITTQEQVDAVKERIRGNLADYGIETAIGGRVHKIGETAKELSDAADALMYKDKLRRKKEKYNTPEQIAAIRRIGQIAAENGLNIRDLPLLLNGGGLDELS